VPPNGWFGSAIRVTSFFSGTDSTVSTGTPDQLRRAECRIGDHAHTSCRAAHRQSASGHVVARQQRADRGDDCNQHDDDDHGEKDPFHRNLLLPASLHMGVGRVREQG
jgi:hypothetical protein